MVSPFMLTVLLSACAGRSLIPDSMIPQSLKGEEAAIFAGSGDWTGDTAANSDRTGDTTGNSDRIEDTAGNSDRTGDTAAATDQSRRVEETEGKKPGDLIVSKSGNEDQPAAGEEAGTGQKRQRPETAEGEKTKGDSGVFVYVHVCGHVKKPGVYKLSAASRVCDAISAAGGLDKEADPAWWNQAAPVTDGMQIRIPSKKEVESGKAAAFADSSAEANTRVSSDSDAQTGADSRESVNINTATVDQLVTIPGIGAKRAEDILRYREEHGKFSSVEDIKNVPGIGDGIYSRMKDHIRVD